MLKHFTEKNLRGPDGELTRLDNAIALLLEASTNRPNVH